MCLPIVNIEHLLDFYIFGRKRLHLRSVKAVFLGSVQHYRKVSLITEHKIDF